MSRIILHIGLRKTGTTSIQKLLNKNHDLLLGHRILYPKSGLPLRESVYAHHDLAVTITGIRPATNTLCWEQLKEELGHHEDKLVFISSEVFSVATPRQIEQVRQHLEGHQVFVLIYLRDPVTFMISLYKEQIKAQNEHLTFGKFIRQRYPLVDYDGLIKSWKNVFGDSNVKLKNYDNLDSSDLLIRNLLESLNLEKHAAELKFLDRANVSPSDEVVIMIRHLNRVKNILPIPQSLRNKIQNNIIDLNNKNEHGLYLLEKYGRYLPKRICTHHEIRQLKRKISSFTSEYKENFQDDLNLTELFRP